MSFFISRRYFEGGVASGFNTVDPTKYEKRLYRCKGKHTIRVEQVSIVIVVSGKVRVLIQVLNEHLC